jgi:hypothetical protein
MSRHRLTGGRWWSIGAAVVVVAAVALTVTSFAFGFTIFRYSSTSAVAPGAFFRTDGHTIRDHNRVCREGNSGQARARYYAPGGTTIISDTGVVWTNCPTALAQLENDGDYISWCRHEGTVSWVIACQTTRP